MNHLAGETSPYLLQHANNPVDWRPWGDDALALAKEEDKPILLSIGYSACHWCHVMEHESFENKDIAALMNESFVNIKVDREERPDLDHIYQTAIQILGRSGGWPLTVFLTPDLKPFFAGTYFPPVDRHGLRAFPRLLTDLARAWKERRTELDRHAEEIARYIGEVDNQSERSANAPDGDVIIRAAASLSQRFDPDNGGFGDRPKFPNTMALELMLRASRNARGADFREKVEFTLGKMIAGGIYDQLGGGFHRYSTDEHWLVPHFEKMTYDNALLLRLLAQLSPGTTDRAARETADYVLREMTHPKGGFYSTQDADSEGEEGAFFAWNEKEIRAVVNAKDADLILRAFGVEELGNFEHGKSVLHRPLTDSQLAKLFNRTEANVASALATARTALYEAREKRIHPNRDEKILSGWNGLMMQGLAAVGVALGEQRYIAAAVACSNFIEANFWRDGLLLRTWRDGQAKITAFAEDYAFLAEGELAVFEATGDAVHLDRARRFVDVAMTEYGDSNGGVFLTRADPKDLIHRPRASHDNAVPSATSSLTMALLRLHAITGEGKYADRASEILTAFGDAMAKNAFGYPYLLCAKDASLAGVGTLVITGAAGDPLRDKLLSTARSSYSPNLIVVPWTPQATPVASIASLVSGKPNEPAAWLCRNGTCAPPAKSVEGLTELLAR